MSRQSEIERHSPSSTTEAIPEEALEGLPEIINVTELASFLRVNHKTLRDAIARGEIPGVRRVGGVIRIHRDTVLSWFASNQDRVSHSRRNR